MKRKRCNVKKCLLVGIVLFLLIIGIVLIFSLKKDNTISLNFEERIKTMNEFETNALKRGWIQVQGTNIDLPVLSATDYISDDDDYQYSWLSGNYIAGQNRKVIVGHNVLNVSNKPISDMTDLQDFEGLMAFTYYDFAKKNLYIQYTDFKTQKETLYLIYAIGFYDYGYDRGEGISDEETTQKYIDRVRKNSIYNYDIDVNGKDTIITVKTCTRFFGSGEKQQFFIDAREIRSDEEITKYKVTKSDVFKELGL